MQASSFHARLLAKPHLACPANLSIPTFQSMLGLLTANRQPFPKHGHRTPSASKPLRQEGKKHRDFRDIAKIAFRCHKFTRDVLAVDEDCALVGVKDASDAVEGRGFACTVWTKQPNNLAITNLKTQLPHRFLLSKTFSQPINDKERHFNSTSATSAFTRLQKLCPVRQIWNLFFCFEEAIVNRLTTWQPLSCSGIALS